MDISIPNLDDLLPDNPTGFPTEEEKHSIDMEFIVNTQSIQDKLNALYEMPGWKMIIKALEDEIDSLKESLVICSSENIIKYQSLILALRFIPKYLNQAAIDSEKARAMLDVFVKQ